MDNLEDLTNDQIRLQLVEHGLANIPVTTTTRKVQLKRLRAAIEAGAPVVGDKTTKNRRETIHVAKVVDKTESVPKPKAAASDNGKAKSGSSRRATISASSASAIPVKTNTPIPFESTTSAPNKVSSRRTSLRASQSGEPPEPANKIVSKVPNIVDVPEESEEDVPFIPISQKRIDRKSRSPSLTKSETVVTAFKQVLARATPIPEEILTISDEEDVNEDVLDDFETSIEPELSQYSDFRKQTVDPIKASYNRSSVGASFANSTTYKPFVADDLKPSQRRYTTTTSTWNQAPVDQRHRTPEKSSLGNEGVLEVNTPYLSDFTRRLSKLRAEPLNEESFLLRRESAVGLDDDEQYYRTSTQVHGRLQQRKPSGQNAVWTYLMSFIRSLEQKYRSIFWPTVILLLIIFVFVVFLA